MTLQGPLTLKMLSLPLYTAPQASHSRRAAERAVGRTVTGMLGALSGWLRHFLQVVEIIHLIQPRRLTLREVSKPAQVRILISSRTGMQIQVCWTHD